MMARWKLGAAVLALAVTTACDSGGPAAPEPVPAPTPPGTWEATHVRGLALPALLYHFDPELLNGEWVSVHILLDSARLVIRPDGTYEHRVRASHWIGEPGGPPVTRTVLFTHGDHGSWSGTAGELRFESAWLQNHRMSGALGGAAALNMQHGFSHGDPPVAIRYGRSP